MTPPGLPPPDDRAAKRLKMLFAVLLVTTVLWMGREIPGFGYAVLMDDDTNLLFNPHLGELDAARLRWMFTDITFIARYMPLGWMTYDLLGRSDLSPAGYHLAGVGFHLVNALLGFFLLEKLLRRFVGGRAAVDLVMAAGLGALLWALHPLRIESVAWCSGVLYEEGGFFALLAVIARVNELEARRQGRGRPGVWFALAAFAFAVSLLIYPVALFLPAVLLILDYAWRKKENLRAGDPRFRLLGFELAILAALSGLALASTLVARQVPLQNALPPPTLREFGLLPRALQAAYVWSAYLWRTFWPVKLTPGVEAIFHLDPTDVRIWATWPTLIGITFLAWRWRRTAPFVGACWLGYLVWMVPVLGLTEHPHVVADRYSYLVSLLFSVVLAFAIVRARRGLAQNCLLVVTGATAALCLTLSAEQARIWRDPVSLHAHIFACLKDPDLQSIIRMRMTKLQFLAGDVRDARARAQTIYAASPRVAGVARAWQEMAPREPLSPEIASRRLQEWRAAPSACFHERLALEQSRQGYLRDALGRLDAALALSPDFPEVRFQRAVLRAQLGRPREALHDWLCLEAGGDPVLRRDGMQFAAGQIAAALRALGDEKLAAALQQRAVTFAPRLR